MLKGLVWISAPLIPVLLSGCINANDMAGSVVGNVGRSAMESARQAPIRQLQPLTYLFDAAGQPRTMNASEHAELEQAIDLQGKRIIAAYQRAYNKRKGDLPVTKGLSRVRITVSDWEGAPRPMGPACVPLALRGDQPEVMIPACFLRSIFTPQTQADREEAGMFAIFGSLTPYTSFREALYFVLGHEIGHIWFNDSDERTLPSIERELRADAWGVIISMAVSPAAEMRARQVRQLTTFGRGSTSSLYEMSLMSTEFGPETLFAVYKNSGFAHGSGTHPPAEERAKLVEKRVDEIFDQQIDKTSLGDIVLWKAGTSAIDTIFGAL